MSQSLFVERSRKLMDAFLHDLETIVNIDSGTYTKAGVEQVARYLEQLFQQVGFSTTFVEQSDYGNHLIATHQGTNPTGPRLFCIGHIDTVFPEHEASRRPFSVSVQDGKRIAFGPGILDMKSGVLMALSAFSLLIQSEQANYQSVTFLCNTDEEVGSPSSKPLIQQLAQHADVALVFEPGRLFNAVVSARKGTGRYRVEVRGRSAHAGVDPQYGRSAILELAHQVIKLQALNGTIPGASLNIGIIHGGERTNVVPDFAYCELDVRVRDQAGLEAINQAMQKVISEPVLEGTEITLSGSMQAMPFEQSERNERLIQLARAAALALDLDLVDVASGGASDANTTAALDLPTLDGLGAAGSFAHNPDEYIELDSLPTRIALICEIILSVCSYYSSGQHL